MMVGVAGCAAEGAPGGEAEAGATPRALDAVEYFVDPTAGVDAAGRGTTADTAWKTVDFAVAQITKPGAAQAGVALNLRAGPLYPPANFPATLGGTAAAPLVVRPYGGPTVTFDAGLPQFRQPNEGWEPVPAAEGGVPGEWRTKASLPTQDERYAWGQLMASKYRLVTYAELGDLRAQNESYARVPLSDPRPALGPLALDPGLKTPLVYMGPGLAFRFDDAAHASGRIHVRLAPTHLNAPGIVDYAGETDPNRVGLSIARKGAVALRVDAHDVVFQNVVVQNGGDATLVVDGHAREVEFQRCEVYGARFGVRVAGVRGVRFRQCTFDGGLAPWTSRSDVKEEYDYLGGPPGCPPGEHGGCHNDLGAKTHDILVIGGASDAVYDHCTFRRGHDGLQLHGQNVDVHHSLFEDLNDEVIQFAGPTVDVRVHENLVRQALHPLSFAVNPSEGPVYVYRNVIDQRVPTRGYRVLPPDADDPYLWRYGADVKNGAMPALYVYQNTFLSSHEVDKGSWVSLLFANEPGAPRAYLNNIHLALNFDRALSNLLPPGTPATTAGNVWYRFQGPDAPLFYDGDRDYVDFASLHAARPDWEVGSLYQDPHLANFTDEYFDYADGPANTDYRPLADLGGMPLPAGLPDVPAYAGVVHAGALPAAAPPLAVGVDGATVLPEPGVPVARAGDDQTLVDVDGDGFASVALAGGASSDPEGAALTYSWRVRGKPVSSSPSPTLLLPEGEHVVRLVVTDPTGKHDSDAVVVNVVSPEPGQNRLVDPGFEGGGAGWALPPGASLTGVAVETHSGARALRLAQTGAAQEVKQRVSVTPGVTYVASGCVKTQGLTPAWATLTAKVLDAEGNTLETRLVHRVRGNSPYAYAEQVVVAAPNAAAVELVGFVDGAGAGKVFFDDLRVRERNLLANGGFETRAPEGGTLASPGWGFGPLTRLEDDAASAHGGRRSIVLVGPAYQLVTSRPAAVLPGRRYRLTGWVRTDGTSAPATLVIRRANAAGVNLGTLAAALPLSEGHYTLFERILSAAEMPASIAALQLALTPPANLPGTTRFDDFVLALLP